MAEDEGRERTRGGVMIWWTRATAATALLYAAGAWAQAPAPTAPMGVRLALAQRIVIKMRTVEQQRFLLAKVSPLFAAQVIASIRSGGPNPLQAKLGSDVGQAEITKVLTEEFAKAFEKRLPQLQEAVATELAARMSESDLRATDTFLDTRSGASWAAATVSAQILSSAAGQRVGSEAGIEAVRSASKRLEDAKP